MSATCSLHSGERQLAKCMPCKKHVLYLQGLNLASPVRSHVCSALCSEFKTSAHFMLQALQWHVGAHTLNSSS